jgi:hypothetical protein
MAYQFIHYETYGLHSRGGGATARGVVLEAEREPAYSKHVAKPKSPKLLYGVNPSELLAELEQNAATARDRSGKRKLPKDAKILLAGVASMPLKTSDLMAAFSSYLKSGKTDKPPALKLYDQWKRLNLDFLREQYGEALRSVVLHYDEEYVHLHYYAANKPKNGTLNLDGLDFASDAERALGMDRKTRNKSGAERKAVRANALRGFQEAYFRGVAKALGWLRLGPQKTRLSRQQYLREKEFEKEREEARQKADSLLINIDSLTSSLATSRQMYNEAKNEISKELGELAQAVRSLRIASTPQKLQEAEQKVDKLTKRLKPRI